MHIRFKYFVLFAYVFCFFLLNAGPLSADNSSQENASGAVEKKQGDLEAPVTPPVPALNSDHQPQAAQSAETTVPQPEQQQQSDQRQRRRDASKQSVKQIGGKKGEVSFFFDDADIFEVAQTVFGEVLKVNYLVDPKVTGRVTFRTVAPIPKADVLSVMEIIFRLNGMGFVEEGGLYRIVPLTDISKELVYSQVGKDPDKVAMELFTFKNLNLKDSIKDIENAIGLSIKGGKVRILPIYRLNALLVVASTKEQLEYVRKWIETFDKMFDVARAKVYVYPVQNSKAQDVASLLQQIFLGSSPSPAGSSGKPETTAKTVLPGQTQQSPAPGAQPQVFSGTTAGEATVSANTRIIPDEITNTVVVLATPEDYERMLETLRKIDIVPRQVMIEAMVAEVKLTDNLRFGLQWLIQNDVKLQVKPFQNDINLDGSLAFKSLIDGATLTYQALDLAGNTKLLIQALADDNKAKILSSPHLLVSDNREARIQVGDQIPIATSTTSTPIGGTIPTNTTTATIQYKDTGTILKVKPQVNDSGLVALEISQEVSKGNTISVLGTQQFIVTKREISTNLVVQDGQTIVLGGLIDETVSKGRSGIPFLSKIPVLGYLFGSSINDTERTELIILLTPHVIRNQQESGKTSSDYLKRFEKDTRIKLMNLTKTRSKRTLMAGMQETGL